MTICLQTEPVFGRRLVSTPDWTGGARSVVSYTTDCWFSWEVPHATVGAVVGLSVGADLTTLPSEPRLAVHFQRGRYAIVTDGTHQTEFQPYAQGTRFYLVRAEGLLFVCIRELEQAPQFDDARVSSPLPGLPVWVQPDPFVAPADEIFLDAALWSTNDSVERAASGLWPYLYAADIPLAPDEFDELTETGSAMLGRLMFESTGFSRLRPDYVRGGAGGVVGELRLDIAAGGSEGSGLGATEGGMAGTLRLEGSARSWSAVEGIPGATEARMYGELRLEGGGSDVVVGPPLAVGVIGGLEFDLIASSRAHEGVAGELRLEGFAADVEIDGYVRGELTYRLIAGQGFDATVEGVSGALILEGNASSFAAIDSGVMGELRFDGGAIGRAIVDAPTGVGGVAGELTFDLAAGASEGAGLAPAEGGMAGLLVLEGEARSWSAAEGVPDVDEGRVYGELRLEGFASEGGTGGAPGAIGGGHLRYLAEARSSLVPDAYFSILLTLGDEPIDGDPGDPGDPGEEEDSVQNQFYIGDMVIATYQNEILDLVGSSSTAMTFYNPQAEVSDALRAAEALQIALVLRFTDAIGAADTQQLIQAANVLETALVSGAVEQVYSAVATVAELISASDAALAAYARTVLDSLGAADSTQLAIRFLSLITDAISAADSLQAGLTIFVEESAAFTVSDDVEFTAQLFANILENVAVHVLLNTPAELVQGWVMNTEGEQPISEYDNFAFNSLAFTGEEMIGAADDGLYLLEADDDAGEPINAVLRTLMMDFRTAKQKRVKSAYLGYTSSGALVMRVRSVESGELVEDWYECRSDAAKSAPGENYLRIGKGLKSRYWQFEVVNVAGADFELDVLELHPIYLTRRV